MPVAVSSVECTSLLAQRRHQTGLLNYLSCIFLIEIDCSLSLVYVSGLVCFGVSQSLVGEPPLACIVLFNISVAAFRVLASSHSSSFISASGCHINHGVLYSIILHLAQIFPYCFIVLTKYIICS
jgi:hypothetical protein